METTMISLGKMKSSLLNLPLRNGNGGGRHSLTSFPWLLNLPLRNGNEERGGAEGGCPLLLNLPLRNGNGPCLRRERAPTLS